MGLRTKKRPLRRFLLTLFVFVFLIGSQPHLAFAAQEMKNSIEENISQQNLFSLSNLLTATVQQVSEKIRAFTEEEYQPPAYDAPYTPARMIPGQTYTIPVQLTNTTTQTWKPKEYVLSYHWTLPDGKEVTTKGIRLETRLPQEIAPGESVEVTAKVRPPIQSNLSNKPHHYILKWDLYQPKKKTWLSKKGGPKTGDYPVTVEAPASDQIGLEKYLQYVGKNTGAGSVAMVNLYNGNLVFSYDPFNNPGIGLNTFVRLTYNSLDTSDSPVGQGWTLSASSIMRVGSPLKFIPNGKKPPREVILTDGDGTRHVFRLKHSKGDKPEYIAPAGVNLYLERVQTGKKEHQWVFTRPDRTQFIFDEEGYHIATRDKNGHELKFIYEKGHFHPKSKVLTKIIDAANRETLTIQYYTKKDTKNPKIIGKIKTITDISGRTLAFTYYDKHHDVRSGTLAKLVDGAGTEEAKVFRFKYDSKSLHTKLVEVTDPRGHTTKFRYIKSGKDKGKVAQIIDRLKGVTHFHYKDTDKPPHNNSEVITTVVDANKNKTKYKMNGYGNPIAITDAKKNTTLLHWDDDNNVDRLEEPNGAVTTWVYDDNGLLLSHTDPVNNAILDPSKRKSLRMEYQYSHNGHVADLVKKVSPEGRTYTFTYDERGNILSVTDPKGNATKKEGDYTTTYTYHGSSGLLHTITDANGNVTTYGDPEAPNYGYDPNGFPLTVTDALGHVTQYKYGPRGEVLAITDAKGKTSEYTYDTFNRPLTSKVPKDQDKGEYIVTPAPVYDENDNIIVQTAPNGAKTYYKYDAADQMIEAKDPPDSESAPERITTYEYDPVGMLIKQTEPLGNLTPDDPDDYTTTYTYDELYQLTSVTNSLGHTITYVYDEVGNLVQVTEPKGNETDEEGDYTLKAKYDLNHRLIEEIDAEGYSIKYAYDHDGNQTHVTNKEGHTLTRVYDERGLLTEVHIPHDKGKTNIIRYEYDQVGNQIKVVAPRGVERGDEEAFTQEFVYDALNREIEIIYPRDPASDDPRYRAVHKMKKYYDEVGNLIKVSAPPSEGQNVRNETTYTYFDNGWMKSSTDPWNITTQYEYNELGLQTKRVVTSAGGSSHRTMGWSYYPDGKLKSITDDGVPVGQHVVLVDNSDAQNVEFTGEWQTAEDEQGYYGYNYHYIQSAHEEDSFTWKLNIPQSGTYTVYVHYPIYSKAATKVTYTIEHQEGSTSKTVDQSKNGGEWVSLGQYEFDETKIGTITVSTSEDGTLLADAVKLVRQNEQDEDQEKKQLDYYYDANGNLITITDSSPDAEIDTYQITYTELNEIEKVEELKDGKTVHTTVYTYDANGNAVKRIHNDDVAEYVYNQRNLVEKIITTQKGKEPTITTFEYTKNGLKLKETKGNGNIVTYSYYWDDLLKEQTEKKPDGTIVNQHLLEYNADGHKVKDTLTMLDANNKTVKSVLSYKYTPLGQIAEYTKTGDNAKTEAYVHDANGNVIKETIDGKTTHFTYDRNRLVSATAQGVTIHYNYDPFGRLDTVTVGDRQIEKYKYDGFDRVTEFHSLNKEGVTERTRYVYDPLDRTVKQTIKAGTEDEKTTEFQYLGLSDQLLHEEVEGKITKSYQYTPWGERLFMVNYADDEQGEYSYYGYNPHTDVEQLTDEQGDPRATYGYTAYGQNDEQAFTGVDKPDPERPDAEPYNSFRFNAKRWDPATQQYDMGFRNYDPGLNRFLTRDMYNGALADLNLAADPYTNNPYAFASGNPITNVEYDGHIAFAIVLVPISAKAIAWTATAVVATAAAVYTAHQISQSDIFEDDTETTTTSAQTSAQTAVKDIAAEVKAHAQEVARKRGKENDCIKSLRNPNVTGQVQYGCTDLSLRVIDQRIKDAKAQTDKKKQNAILRGSFTYAAVEYIDNQGNIQYKVFRNISFNEIRANPDAYKGRPAYGVHAEELMDEWLQDHGITPDRVRRIYIEQSPCGRNPYQCSSIVNKYQKAGAKVTYSFYTEADKKAIIRAVLFAIRGILGF